MVLWLFITWMVHLFFYLYYVLGCNAISKGICLCIKYSYLYLYPCSK